MNAATAYTCPNCHALCSPGQRCPVCGQYVPTPAEVAAVAAIGRATLAHWAATTTLSSVPPLVTWNRHRYVICPPPGEDRIG